MTTTCLRRLLAASRTRVYEALIDAQAVSNWMVPHGMRSHIHHFEPRVGGAFRISLTYDTADGAGKTTANTDNYRGRFVELVPGERVIETMDFETDDPAMRGQMTVTFLLADAECGTELVAIHENVPPGISPADNEAGWRMSLDKLAAYVETGTGRA